MESARLKIGVFAFVLLLLLVPLLIAISSPRAFDALKTKFALTFQKPKVTKIDKQIGDVQREQHPALYFADLEYDPTMGKIEKKASGYFNGDIPSFKSQAFVSPDTFSFGVEAISPSKQVLFSGWESLYKAVITTKDGKYFFRVSVPYTTGEILSIYSIGYEKLWQEEIR